MNFNPKQVLLYRKAPLPGRSPGAHRNTCPHSKSMAHTWASGISM